jgi:DNA-binding XRE family transcriptional regulator
VALPPDSKLRARRLTCGLTQGELAARADVSRQLVAAVEAGRNTPAVDAALGLARALGTTVEELFEPSWPDVAPAVGERLRAGVPLRVGRVAEQFVAVELADHGTAGSGWARPDAVFEGGRLRLFPGAVPAGLVLAGCDPALGIAESMLAGLGAGSLLAISAPTGAALGALERGRVHAAVVHGRAGELPDPPIPVVRWHLARWQVGLGIAPALGAGGSLASVLAADVPVVQRDPAAASQQAFEKAARDAGMPASRLGPRAAGHLDAARMAAMLGGIGVTNESAARAFGLGFLALADHTVEVWLAERWLAHPGANALGELLVSRGFSARVGQFAGYDLTGCGTRIEAARAVPRSGSVSAT